MSVDPSQAARHADARLLPSLLANKLRIGTRRMAAVREESKLKVAFVTLGATLLWLGLFLTAFHLLRALGSMLDSFASGAGPALADLLIARLVAAATLALLFLLLVSNLVIAHANLFRSAELRFLLGKPITPESLLLLCFSEGLVMSSWASAYLASPAVLAYGLVREAPWFYYPIAALLGLAFALLPATLGVLAMVLGSRVIDRLGRRPGIALAAGALVAVVVVVRRAVVLPAADQLDAQRVIALLSIGSHPLGPNTWFADGLMAAADGRLGDTVFAIVLLVANAALILWLACLAARAWLLSVLTSAEGGGKRTRRRGLLAGLDQLFGPLPQPGRALIVKDIRLFWRDPAQWIQFAVFFGLLALYAGNLSASSAMLATSTMRSWIAALNVAVCLLVLATLTTRFVFPLISLEGRRWWLLGLSPVSLGTVLRLKLALAATTTAGITVGLALLSAHRLGLTPVATGLTVSSVLLATVALSGLAIGLGSLYPNFEEDQPAKIVSGLGGTLSFLLSMVYVTAVVACLTLVLRSSEPTPSLLTAVAAAIVALSALTCWLPMHLGHKHLERLGF